MSRAIHLALLDERSSARVAVEMTDLYGQSAGVPGRNGYMSIAADTDEAHYDTEPSAPPAHPTPSAPPAVPADQPLPASSAAPAAAPPEAQAQPAQPAQDAQMQQVGRLLTSLIRCLGDTRACRSFTAPTSNGRRSTSWRCST